MLYPFWSLSGSTYIPCKYLLEKDFWQYGHIYFAGCHIMSYFDDGLKCIFNGSIFGMHRNPSNFFLKKKKLQLVNDQWQINQGNQ